MFSHSAHCKPGLERFITLVPEVWDVGCCVFQVRIVGGEADFDGVLEVRVDVARLVVHLQLKGLRNPLFLEAIVIQSPPS
jgi:hypothetical protein